MGNTFFLAAFAAGIVTALPLYRRDSSDLFDIQSFQNVTLQACGNQTSGNITVSSVTETWNANRGQGSQENTSVFPALHTAAVAAEAKTGVYISASVCAASASAFATPATAPPPTSLPNSRVNQILDAQFGDKGAVNEDVEELSNLEFIISGNGECVVSRSV
ncbi:hypothetical protein DFH09DRAFT_1072428 [Mycena vulgaris]|nr:hypothetical protein DFH09DRAFT_1072428 [Mycena vulgaris]